MELTNYDKHDDSEDLDLLDLILSDSSTTNKYLLFEGSNGESYGINVSKVIEILVFKNLEMVKNGDAQVSLIRGTAQIREELSTIINFDEWFGNEVLDDSEYEYIILAGFGGYNLGIMIKSVDYIVSIDSIDMKDNSINNPKTNFISKVKINNIEKLCTIFDCDKLLLDVFEVTSKKNDLKKIQVDKQLSSERLVLFADDSRFIRKMVESLFEKLGLKYEIFQNGKELLDAMLRYKPEDIALLITDIEMPIMDGIQLVKSINELEGYESISIIVHTNMSKFVIESSLRELGVDEVIDKIDMKKLSNSIIKYL